MDLSQRVLPEKYPIELELKLIETLSSLGEFETQLSMLTSVFTHGKLRKIRSKIATSTNISQRVKLTLQVVAENKLLGEMLVILEQGYPSTMVQHNKLSTLAKDVMLIERH